MSAEGSAKVVLDWRRHTVPIEATLRKNTTEIRVKMRRRTPPPLLLALLLLLLQVAAAALAAELEAETLLLPSALVSDEAHDEWADALPVEYEDADVGANGRYNETTALYLAHVTSVSYCQEHHVRNWSCGPCALVPPLREVHVVQDAKDNFQGLVGYSELYDAVVIAFRGSMDVRNWIDNLTFLKKRAYTQFPGVLVHEGFYWAYRSVATDLTARVKALRKQHPDSPVLVTGHSLGGAVAAICAFEMKYIAKQPVHMLYTFGKPRVGNERFSTLLRNSSMEVYRVTHFRDVVPHLPPQFVGFYHTTQEVYYDQFSATYRNCSRDNGEDPSCSNNCSYFGCTSIVDHLTYLNITMSHLIC